MARKSTVIVTRLISAAIAAIILLGLGAASASAQVAPPPVRTATDANGVDLLDGTLRLAMPSISVGQPGAGGLVYTRTYDSSALTWRDAFAGGVQRTGNFNLRRAVTLFGRTYVFGPPGAGYPPLEADGSTLTFDATTNTYTLTTPDGAVAVYSKTLAGTSPTVADEGRIVSYTDPGGVITTFTYTVLNSGTQRLQSITNSLGYQIAYRYQNNDPSTGGLTLLEVMAINNSIDYCAPSANGCAGMTQTWPRLTFDAATPTTVTDVLGRVTRYSYAGGRLSGLRRPSSAIDNVTFAYANGRVASVSNGTGNWTYAYVDNPDDTRTTTVTDPLSHQRVVVSNLATNLVQSDRDALNRTTSFQYDSSSRITRVTHPEGNNAQFVYDGRGNLTSTTHAAKAGSGLANIVTSASYPTTCTNQRTCNQPTSVSDARGNVTDFTYDPTHGGVLTITAPDPDGAGPAVRPQTRIAYQQLSAYYKNSSGAIVAGPALWLPTEISACATTASCANGADETRTVIDYGANGVANNRLPVATTVRAGNNAVSASSSVAYDAIGNPITIDGPLSGTADTTRTHYNAARQVIGVVGPDPDGAGALKPRAQRFSYNLDGQVTSLETGTVNAVTDAWPTTFAALEQATLAYDAIGRNTRRDFVAGGGTQAVTQYSYDSANRLECAALRMNPGVFASLPGSACTLSTQGSNGPDRISRNTYSNADEIASVTSGYGTPSPIVEATSTYSANGLRASLADGAGNVSVFVYDGHDRLSRLRYPNASGGGTSTADYEEYSYDVAGNVTQTRRRDGQLIGASYDGLGRVTLMDAPGTANDVSYAYDNFSRQTGAGALNYAYDQLSRLTSAVAAQGTLSYQYDAASRRTRMNWPDGFYVTYDYDLTNAMTAMRENGAASGAGVLASLAYDNLGRRVSLTRGNGAVTAYAYDAASRLQTLTQDLPGTSFDQTYGLSYNAASQVTQRSGSNAAYDLPAPANTTTTYADNGLNQYTSVAGATPSYDARGNLTALGGATYGYDIFNRLISATPAGGAAATLSYDPAGRLAQVAGAATTRFLYDGADMIAEYNGSNVLQRRAVHGPGVDEPLVWYEGAGTADRRYLIADQLGSIVAANGNTTDIYSYDEYGQPNAWTGARFRYTGQMMLPEAQLYHYKARAYHPGLGRFAQTDPILYGGGMNVYAYVRNDPVNFTDPSGLNRMPDEEEEIIVTGRRRCTSSLNCDVISGSPLTIIINDPVLSAALMRNAGTGEVATASPPQAGDQGFVCPSQEQVQQLQNLITVGQMFESTGGLGMVAGLAMQADPRAAVGGRVLFGESAAMAAAGGVVSSTAYVRLASLGHEQDAANALIAAQIAAYAPAALQPFVAQVAQDTLSYFQGDTNLNTCP
ncbi:MAG: RHS repeat-associated core domain-containing protein [Terricaulis sp.]